MYAYLERTDSVENHSRFYRFELFSNLFGDWQLDREWGRVGQAGTIARSLHQNGEDALSCAHAMLAYQVDRGYEVRVLDCERSNILGFVPQTERAVLNLKLCTYFTGHRIFQDMAIRMYRHNIIYMGEFVQLPGEDVAMFLPKGIRRTADYFEMLRSRRIELTKLLAECNLTLGSKLKGWVRPDGERLNPLLVGQNLRRCRRQRTVPISAIHGADLDIRKKLQQRSTRLSG